MAGLLRGEDLVVVVFFGIFTRTHRELWEHRWDNSSESFHPSGFLIPFFGPMTRAADKSQH
jgi:hypothetical protein